MDFIAKKLSIIDNCIKNSVYTDLETDKFELKDLSSEGSWSELYRTVCAFLNTNGGTIIIGIKDKGNEKDKTKKHYRFTGFNYDNEPKLKAISQQFTHEQGYAIDLKNYFPTPEIRDFQTGQVAIIYVDELPDDEKYVFYDKKAYKREFTGDHKLTDAEIEAYRELKEELISNQETTFVKNTTLATLNIDKLNDYIIRLNRNRKIENIKSDIAAATSFLDRKGFIRNEQPTLLGMLVCGNHVEDYLQGRCDVNCSVDLPKSITIALADAKQRYQDNIIPLFEYSFAFIWRNIQVGVIYANSGTAAPEYPEDLIRESINNALAHRNYASIRPIIIEIKPKKYLMIQNPGAFAKRQIIHLDSEFGKIRRILRIQISRNPKLTNLLYSFDRFEGEGNGLAALINACLDNLIDVPYYVLVDGEIKLFVPTGKVYDDAMETWIKSFSGYIEHKMLRELSQDEKIMLSFFRKSELINRLEYYTILLSTDNNHKEVIANLEERNLVFIDPQSAPLHPIYRIDRNLMRVDFSNELNTIFGGDWQQLSRDATEILITLYHFEHYSKPVQISANFLATCIFVKKHTNTSNIAEYEKYRARVRSIVSRLEEKQFIVRSDGKTKKENGKPDFKINKAYTTKNKTLSFV